MPSHFALFKSFFASIILNNSTSSYLHLCLLFYDSFSFLVFYTFSIALSSLMLFRTLELWKCSQPLTTNKNTFKWLPYFFHSWMSHLLHFIFYLLTIFYTKRNLKIND
jgi:hypothetical protein